MLSYKKELKTLFCGGFGDTPFKKTLAQIVTFEPGQASPTSQPHSYILYMHVVGLNLTKLCHSQTQNPASQGYNPDQDEMMQCLQWHLRDTPRGAKKTNVFVFQLFFFWGGGVSGRFKCNAFRCVSQAFTCRQSSPLQGRTGACFAFPSFFFVLSLGGLLVRKHWFSRGFGAQRGLGLHSHFNMNKKKKEEEEKKKKKMETKKQEEKSNKKIEE